MNWLTPPWTTPHIMLTPIQELTLYGEVAGVFLLGLFAFLFWLHKWG